MAERADGTDLSAVTSCVVWKRSIVIKRPTLQRHSRPRAVCLAVAAWSLSRAEEVVLHHHLEAREEWPLENRVGVLREVDVGVRAEDAIVELHRAGDVPPLLGPHQELRGTRQAGKAGRV